MGSSSLRANPVAITETAATGIEVARYRQAMISAYRAEFNRALAGDGELTQAEPASGRDDEFRLSPHAYPGLRSFSPHEGGVFFGREPNIKEVQRRLAEQRVVVVLGGSGSGKSSVIRAGLMPRLNSTLAIKGRSGNWYAVEFRPRQQPMEELAAALANLVKQKFPQQGVAIPEETETRKVASSRASRETTVHARLRERFHLTGKKEVSSLLKDRVRRAHTLSKALFEFVDHELDRRDWQATRGYRSGSPSLLLVIDQFEEIFRPEVPTLSVGGRQDMLDMIIAVYARLHAERIGSAANQTGLFLAITMRSEEVHRCAEHPGLEVFVKGQRREQRSLADLVNASGYLLDLLDPKQDRQQLTDAIVRPARRVFEDWGLPLDPANKHAPFEQSVVEWLLDGAAQLSEQLEHRADQLPLLQHGLQSIWHNAIEEWSKVTKEPATLVVRRRHLHCGPTTLDAKPADLIACLDGRANDAFERATARFVQTIKRDAPVTAPDDKYKTAGEAAVCAAFRSLARRDDRGNWARRFAELGRMLEFLTVDPLEIEITPQIETAVQEALQEFIASGYLTGGHGQPYDISHEALIRNWRQFQIWLLEPDEAAQALVQVVNFFDVDRPTDAISFALARSLAHVVGYRPTLPESWAKEQILPLLARQNLRRRWSALERWSVLDLGRGRDLDQLSQVILERIGYACRVAESERFRTDRDSYWEYHYERLRLIFRRALVATISIAMLIIVGVIVLAWGSSLMRLVPNWLGTAQGHSRSVSSPHALTLTVTGKDRAPLDMVGLGQGRPLTGRTPPSWTIDRSLGERT
jgi:energy-coupling factor transporter ATP-binding protein EcfA2